MHVQKIQKSENKKNSLKSETESFVHICYM